jgi:WD40 repeat protein
MQKLELFASLKGHTQSVWNVAWSPNGQVRICFVFSPFRVFYVFKVLASCGGDKTICLWARDDRGEWALHAKLVDAHERTIRKVCFFVQRLLVLTCVFPGVVVARRTHVTCSQL